MPDARSIALAWSLGRAALGATIAVAPEPLSRGWIGSDAARPGARALGTALGARDFVLGLGTAAALRSGEDARMWIAGCALADAADFTATLVARRNIPRTGLIGVGALAGGSAALGAWLATAVD
jgi:hypothetical protein